MKLTRLLCCLSVLLPCAFAGAQQVVTCWPAESEAQPVACDFAAQGAQVDAGEALLSAVNALQRNSMGDVDWKGGLELAGAGAGGAAALSGALTVPSDFWRALVAAVDVRDLDGAGALDLDAFERAAASGAVDGVRFHATGTGLEPFFRTCERHGLSCQGAWGEGAQSTASGVRLDQVLPVFSGANTTRWGTGGYYNAGLEWRGDGILRSDAGIAIPLRYRRGAYNWLPARARFDLTLRRLGKLGEQAGQSLEWSLGPDGPRGRAKVAQDGSVTIAGLALASGDQYTGLFLKAPPPDWQLVYTRQPRAREPQPGTPIKEAANWQHATDVGRINSGIAEADVVIDDLNGRVKVIHNCTESQAVCVAHEARVSPDGTRIVYSVGHGNALQPVVANGIRLSIQEIPALTHAELWLHDLRTGKSEPIPHHPPRAIDRQPEWLDNERIVFASNRAETYPPKNQFSMHLGSDQFGQGRCFNAPYCVSQEYGYGRGGMSMQIWSMNIDGTDARNLTPHEGNALAPAVMSNGDILYSCWNAHENKSFDAAGRTANNPGTSKNKWWLCRMDANGGDGTVILNGHKTTELKTRDWLPGRMRGGEGRSELRAIRSVAEIFKGRLAVSNYYRSNHVGSMGIVFALDYEDPHVEGCSTAACYPHGTSNSRRPGSGRFVPSSLVALTPYGTDQDMDVRRDEKGRPLGKAGYAAPLPDTETEYLVTHARGFCYEVAQPNQANRRAMGGEPTCQKAIYRVKVPIVTDPFDTRQMELMAGGDAWQAFDARAIATYQSLHGQALPDQLPPLDENANCYLQVVDARAAELDSAYDRYNWQTNLFSQCALQGCAVNTEDGDFHRDNLAALTIYLPEMWDFTYGPGREKAYQANVNNMGHKSIAILGSQPLQPDGSVKMQVPCETPLLMAGTDGNGMSIAHDAMLHSLRRGETRTCHGCHDGHSEERARRLQRSAVERFAATQAANTLPPLPTAQQPITFNDVRPILERRCSGCHKDMNDRDGLLYSRVAQDYEQFDWPWARKQPGVGQRKAVEHVLIKAPGRGYSVGDALVFGPGGAAGQVAAVGAGGGITAIKLTRGGDGYQPLTDVTVQSQGGSGARLRAMTSLFELPRPYTSKWVAKFARDSLLYWKCLGSRQDGRTDRQYPNDIDFGPAHDSGATAQECRTIGQWIDTGIQRQ